MVSGLDVCETHLGHLFLSSHQQLEFDTKHGHIWKMNPKITPFRGGLGLGVSEAHVNH